MDIETYVKASVNKMLEPIPNNFVEKYLDNYKH